MILLPFYCFGFILCRAFSFSCVNCLVSSFSICCKAAFSSVLLISLVWLFAIPWTAACQASLSIANSQSLFKPMSIDLVMPSNYLILCHPLFLLPSIFPSIWILSNESVLCIETPKYWNFSFNISLSNEYSGLISFRMDWLDLLAVQGTLKSLLQNPQFKSINSLALSFLYITGSIVELMGPPRGLTPRDTSQDSWYQCPLPHSLGELPPTHTSTVYPPTLAGRSGSVSCRFAAPFLWILVHTRFCLGPPWVESLSHSVLWKSCKSIPLGFKVRYPGYLYSICWISRLGSLTWGSEPSQQCENIFGIIVLQFMGHPPSRYGMWFYCDYTPPTISLQLLLCPWIFFFFAGFLCPSISGCVIASCDFGVLTGEAAIFLF